MSARPRLPRLICQRAAPWPRARRGRRSRPASQHELALAVRVAVADLLEIEGTPSSVAAVRRPGMLVAAPWGVAPPDRLRCSRHPCTATDRHADPRDRIRAGGDVAARDDRAQRLQRT